MASQQAICSVPDPVRGRSLIRRTPFYPALAQVKHRKCATVAKKKSKNLGGRPSIYQEPTEVIPTRLPQSVIEVADSLGCESRNAALVQMLKQSPQYLLANGRD